MANRMASVVFLGNDDQLNATLARIEMKLKALSDTADVESAKMQAGADAAGLRFGSAFDEGTTKAGSALTRLGKTGESWGIPLSASLTKMGSQFDQATSKTGKLDAALSSIGKLSFAAGIAAFGVAAVAGVKGAMDLQTQMLKIHTQAGASEAEVKKMTAAVLGMAGSVGTGPLALSEALYHVESVGLRGAKALDVLKVAAEGAQVGGANLTDVTNALDAAVISGISGVQSYKQAMGSLNATVGAGDMTMQDLSDALGTGILATAKTFGLTMNSVGAALADFGDNNIRGAAAATKLRQVIMMMGAPSAAAAKALNAIGVSQTQLNQNMRSGGLIDALTDLKQHLIDSGATASQQSEILARAFGGSRTAGSVMILLSQLDRLKNKQQEISKSGQNFGADWQDRTKQLSFEFDQLKASVEAVADRLGEVLIPILQSVASVIGNSIDWLTKHKAAVEALAFAVGSILGPAMTVFAFQKMAGFVEWIGKGTLAVQKLGSWVLENSASVGKSLGIIGTAGSTAGNNVGTGMTDAETAVSSAGPKLSSAAAADTAAITDEFGTPLMTGVSTKVDAAMAAAETDVTAAKVPLAAEAAEDGTAIGAGFAGALTLGLAGVPAILAMAITQIGSKTTTNAAEVAAHHSNLKPGSPGAPIMGPKGQIIGYTPTSTASSTGVGALPSGGITSPITASSTQTTAAQLVAYLESQGYNKNAAAGLAGNVFGGEDTTGRANLDQGGATATMPTAGVGFGLAQWTTASRQSALEAYAIQHQVPVDSVAAQEGFLAQEAASLKTQLNAAPSAASAALIAENDYESPLGTTGTGLTPNLNPSTAAREQLAAQLASQGSVGPTPGVYGKATPGTPSSSSSTKAKVPLGTQELDQYLASQTATGSLNPGAALATISSAINKYQAAQTAAQKEGNTALAKLDSDTVTQLQALYTRMDPELQSATTSHAIALLENTLKTQLSSIESHNSSAVGVVKTQQAAQVKATSITTTVMDAVTKYLTASTTARGLGQPALAGADTQIAAQLKALIGEFVPEMQRALTGPAQAAVQSAFSQSMATITGKSSTEKALGSKATTLLTALQGEIQGGSTSSLEKTLGYSSKTKKPGGAPEQLYTGLVAGLEGTHSAALKVLTNQLVEAHKQALQTLHQDLVAHQDTVNAESIELQAVQTRDQAQSFATYQQDQLTVVKDAYAQINDTMTAAATQLKDTGQIIQDEFAGMVTLVEDATQSMADASSGIVTGIQDQTQTQVDILGERGLYGLTLIAQQDQVAYDQAKAYYDQQIAVATNTYDTIKTQTDAQIAAAQANLDQVQATQDQAVAIVQQTADTVQIAGDTKLAAAQAHADSVQLRTDLNVQLAQATVDLSANESSSAQAAANAQLKQAQSIADQQNALAAKDVDTTTASVNAQIAKAAQEYTVAQNQAATYIAQATNNLSTIQGQANVQLAQASASLQSIQDVANQQEAHLQAVQQIMQETAQTEFAGSGIQVNMYGLPMNNAAAISTAMDWVWRTQINTAG